MDKWLKKIPAKKLQVENNTDSASTSEQEENGRADTCTASTSYLSAPS